jgi:hypothetical protein
MRYQFETTCVTANARDLEAMEEKSRDITRRTFLKYVDYYQIRALETILGYDDHHMRGMTMASDHHVRYYKSWFRGKRCVGFDWSSIDHIFCEVK